MIEAFKKFIKWLTGIVHNNTSQELAYILAAIFACAALLVAWVGLHWPSAADHSKGLVDRFLMASASFLGIGKTRPDSAPANGVR